MFVAKICTKAADVENFTKGTKNLNATVEAVGLPRQSSQRKQKHQLSRHQVVAAVFLAFSTQPSHHRRSTSGTFPGHGLTLSLFHSICCVAKSMFLNEGYIFLRADCVSMNKPRRTLVRPTGNALLIGQTLLIPSKQRSVIAKSGSVADS